MAFHPVYATTLYRSLKKQVLSSAIKDKWPEIGKELVLLKDTNFHVAWDQKKLSYAFFWFNTPQGREYWHAIQMGIEPNWI